MSTHPATEKMIEHAEKEAREIADEYGWDTSHPFGVMRAWLTMMEHAGETPTDFARKRGWIE